MEGMPIFLSNLYLCRCPLILLYILTTNLPNMEVRFREFSYPNLPGKPLIYHLLWLRQHAETFQRMWGIFYSILKRRLQTFFYPRWNLNIYDRNAVIGITQFFRSVCKLQKIIPVTTSWIWTVFERKGPWLLHFVLHLHSICSSLVVLNT